MTGDANSAAIGDDTARVLDAREELVIELRDQVKFLRTALEARDRDAAELRAALRTALAAMPKALTDGESSTQNVVNESAQNAPQAPQNVAAVKAQSSTRNAPQMNRAREMRPLWKVILGIR